MLQKCAIDKSAYQATPHLQQPSVELRMDISTVKARVARRLQPYPAVFGYVRRIGNTIGVTTPSEHDVIFDLCRRRGRNVFFLQVGANDGRHDDPIHHLVRRYGWQGILLEPVPQNYDRLKANYRDVGGLTFVNAALSRTDGSATFYQVRTADHLPTWCRGLGSFRRDVIASHRDSVPDIESHIVAETIESISFCKLIDRYKPPRIDLVLIDTEGYDLEILRQIDLDRFRPELIIFEHKHLAEKERASAAELLTAHGYQIATTRWPNTTAVPIKS
jgi:FkbM family methyltransferase